MTRHLTAFRREIDRRTFLSYGAVGLTAVATQSPVPETFSEWLKASRKGRELGLQLCLDRIQTRDAAIQAWVQVQPQPSTGNGKIADIPFGVKDVIETKGLATEYGSPI